MAKYATPNAVFEASVYNVGTGLIGTITAGIEDGQGNVVSPAVTTGIVESPAGSGVYTATRTAPASTGQYNVIWHDGAGNYAAEDLSVTTSTVLPELGVGAIADRVRAFIPATYDAMTAGNFVGMFTAATAGYYTGNDVARVINSAKFRLFGTSVSYAMEATVYNDFTLDYVAKVAALRIIPAGADFWSDQFTSETAREESRQYPDRIASLWRIHERLLNEVAADKDFFDQINGTYLRRSAKNLPGVSTPGELQTTDPKDLGTQDTPYRFGHGRNPYVFPRWSEWE